MDWHVFFTKTGYEPNVVRDITNIWRIDGIKPFIPLYDVKFRSHGKVTLEKRRLFPGYVFVESKVAPKDFWYATRDFIGNSRNILKLLTYDNDFDGRHQAAITSEEQQALMKLFRNNNCQNQKCVEMSIGIIEGDRVRVTDGPLMGQESLIKKVKRHRMEAVIEVEIMGAAREITVGLEIVERVDT